MAKVPSGKARLHLLSERSMGLSSIPVGKGGRSKKTPAVRTEPVATPPTLKTLSPPPVTHRETSPQVAAKPPATRVASTPIATAAPTAPVLFASADGPPTEPITDPVLDTEHKRIALQQMDERQVRVCRACRLCETRTNTVFGEGDVDARLMFIGEGPGENEDLSGRPFVGRAGDLLEKQINAMGLRRDQVFIANVVKCRPPGNRAPAPDETLACTPFLVRQIEIVRPTVIVTLGLPATQFVLSTKVAMGKLRGQWHVWRGIAVMPTYHPAYLLRNYTEEVRRMVWSDLQLVIKRLKSDAPAKEN